MSLRRRLQRDTRRRVENAAPAPKLQAKIARAEAELDRRLGGLSASERAMVRRAVVKQEREAGAR